MTKRIVVLGATGSIGTQTLDVVRGQSDRLSIHGLSAHRRWRELLLQAEEFQPAFVTLTDPDCVVGEEVSPMLLGTKVLRGESGIETMVRDPATDIVVAAMVGAAGLRGTAAAVDAGKTIALANKETLVVGGSVITRLARQRNVDLLPVDSEHSAIFQCMRSGRPEEVRRIVLTASGGPFRELSLEAMAEVTREQALKHPTWQMGPKITIDSATMMNKALEIIEAHWLFGLSADQIGVMIHPESVVHSFVEFVDGSVVAQASPPDMRLPIQFALTYPDRTPGPARRLDWQQAANWRFFPPDLDRFPALALGYTVVRAGGTAGAAVNAANEVAVERFLQGQLRFTDIVTLSRTILEHHTHDAAPTLADLEQVDRWARREAFRWISC